MQHFALNVFQRASRNDFFVICLRFGIQIGLHWGALGTIFGSPGDNFGALGDHFGSPGGSFKPPWGTPGAPLGLENLIL